MLSGRAALLVVAEGGAGPLAGFRVLEVAAWTFVPAAGAVLAEWGADVIKVEQVDGGDPQRGLISSGLVPAGAGGVNYMIEVPNRGKRSIGLDLSTPGGRDLLLRLAADCDVFLTSFLPRLRTKLGIDVDDLRAVNPDIVYVRGSGHGAKGPDVDRPGYDGVTYWSRGGIGHQLTENSDAGTPIRPRPAFGDVMGGLTLAGGIAAALLKRATTGETSVVDVSLLGLALWNLGPDVTSAKLYEDAPARPVSRAEAPNPLVGTYRTADGRWITLMMLQSDRFWPEAATLLGLAELIDDPRFADAAARFAHRAELIRLLDQAFAEQPLEVWKQRLAPLSGAWAPMQSPHELHEDPAVLANGYLPQVTSSTGTTFALPTNPVQFDGVVPIPSGAPEHGQHTEEVLLDLGLSWSEIAACKDRGEVL